MTDEFRDYTIHALKVGEDIGECATDAVGLVCPIFQLKEHI